MKIRKFLSIITIVFLASVIVGCMGEQNDDNPFIPGTPFTDELKLTATYSGKSFINDGIGEVTLSQNIDGDTATFKDNIANETFNVRFNGVDTPESTYRVEQWGFAAASFTAEKLTNAKKIVLQADEVKTARLDSTGKRYLAWVWYIPKDGENFRLLPLELIENSYSLSKSAGTMYSEVLQSADLNAAKNKIRLHNLADKDPAYDYSKYGQYYTLKELRQYGNADIANEKNKGMKVRVQGIVAVTVGVGSAYIQQQEDGNWFIGTTDTGISTFGGETPYVGTNGNWFIGESDLGVKANGGSANQSAYEYYAANAEQPLTEKEWLNYIVVSQATESFDTPYIVKDLTWYGMYLYGGFSAVNKLVTGREIYVEGNLGYYGGAMQITDVSNTTVGIINASRVDPFVKEVTIEQFMQLGNTSLGCLVKMENLVVSNGYDTTTNNGYTIYAKVNGVEVSIRVDTATTIKMNNTGDFDPNGTVVVTSWKAYEGKTFKSITGIFGVYNGTYQLQLMGNTYFEIA